MSYAPFLPPPGSISFYGLRPNTKYIKSAFKQAREQQKANFEKEQARFIKGP